ncbi:BgTH12-03987 [Blumeria graminis f. sp. triticale]|uniref:BgTH12-03987 n=1 Tax=Blumeria graminis f. sp. triticale TaxID=1689686 RepID=A0A9W4GCP1_BLUGR|nr:BgTH12-03987 [Blumeria graminis f. sp. triticale]
MRCYIIALILHSVSFSVAYLEDYQTPHIPEEQKTFNCGDRFYGSYTLDTYRDSFTRSPNEFTASTAKPRKFSDIVSTRYIREKVMYHEDQTTTMLYLMLIFSNTDSTHLTEDFLVFDDQRRMCAVKTKITAIRLESQYSTGPWTNPVPYETLCEVVV